MVYLDYNATTPLAEAALEAMMPYLARHHGNPSSIHREGREARAAVDHARDSLAVLLGARPHEIIFTGGGTEANNLAILGLARAHRAKGTHLITGATEHHAVLHAFEYLRDREDFELTILPVNHFGQVDPEQLRASLRPDTILVSLMSANNETGVLHPISEISKICKERGVLFHSDFVQSFGKQPMLPPEELPDALSLAAHKFYGPKGVGALYLRAGIPLETLHFGGFHENQRRPGTENVAGIVGLAAAATWVNERMPEELPRLRSLRDELWARLEATAVRNGHPTETLPNTLNISFPGLDGETLLIALDLEGLCVSSGSACMVGSVLPSHVLLAMEVPPKDAQATVRLSLGNFTKEKDINLATQSVERVLRRLLSG